MNKMDTPTLDKREMRQDQSISPKSTNQKNSFGKKIVLIVVMILLMILTSVIVSNIVHKRSNESVPVSGKVENGLSAYELAVQQGYDGSVQDWLNSLSGKSAYEIAVDNGYTGTEDEWASALAASAKQGNKDIKTASFSEKGELLITLSDNTVLNLGKAVGSDGKNGANGLNGKDGINGVNGQNGADGKNGIDGKDGVNGVGITAANINTDGQLVLNFSDGNTVNLDKIVGMNGKDGVSVAKSEISESGELILTYSNGQSANLGKIIGTNGKDGLNGTNGINGTDGADGVSITNSSINPSGELVLTYSDGTVSNLGVVIGSNGTKGADGKDGINGINGQDGTNGVDGIGVTGAEINSNGELVLSYSNGQRSNLGNVIGANGKDGANGTDGINGVDGKDGVNGVDGKNGISVVKSEINTKGELVLTYSDNTVSNLGVVVGANGKDGSDGVNGTNGIDGADGIDGVGIESININSDNQLEIFLSSGTKLNLGNIKGADGKDGKNGIDGVNGADGIGVAETTVNELGELILTYSNGKSVNLGNVVGTDGKDGANGTNGIDGTNGVDGADGRDGISVAQTVINENGELIITYSDGNSANLGKIVGSDGRDGKDGLNGADGKDGTNGVDGINGQDGIGVSKSEINENGELVIIYSNGTTQNLGKIVGTNGKDGINGENGVDGVTPQIRVNEATGEWEVSEDNGITWTFTGAKAVGTDGKDGTNGADGKDGKNGIDGKDGIGISNVSINADGELILTFSDNASVNLGSIKGKDGKDGINGVDGTNGRDGVGIANVTVSPEGALTVELTSGTVLNLGNVKGENGIGITKSEINAGGELILTYTDGKTENLGAVVGRDGTNGVNGQDGKDGVGIKSVTLSTDGNLIILMTNNSVTNLGNIKGEKGDKGDTGAQGEKGEPGKDGRGIAKTELINGELVITYTDGTSDNLGNISENVDNSIFEFVLNTEDTYGVKLKSEYAKDIDEITIPEKYQGKVVSTILGKGFKDATNLKKVTIGNNIAFMKKDAFAGCTNLNVVYYKGSIEQWCNITFQNAYANPVSNKSSLYIQGELLSSAEILGSVKTINSFAFYNCTSLQNVVLSEGIETIGKSSFAYCDGITEITIPTSMQQIGPYAFYKTALTIAVFEDSLGWTNNGVDNKRGATAAGFYSWQSISDPRTYYASAYQKDDILNDVSIAAKYLTTHSVEYSTTFNGKVYKWTAQWYDEYWIKVE